MVLKLDLEVRPTSVAFLRSFVPWSATAARPVALEGVGEHVRVEVITQPEFGGEIAESFRKRKETFSCRVGSCRE